MSKRGRGTDVKDDDALAAVGDHTYLVTVRKAWVDSDPIERKVTVEGPERKEFRRGDADSNGDAALEDAIDVLGWLFLGTPASLPAPGNACGADDSGEPLGGCAYTACEA